MLRVMLRIMLRVMLRIMLRVVLRIMLRVMVHEQVQREWARYGPSHSGPSLQVNCFGPSPHNHANHRNHPTILARAGLGRVWGRVRQRSNLTWFNAYVFARVCVRMCVCVHVCTCTRARAPARACVGVCV